jgi:hypothetical protein
MGLRTIAQYLFPYHNFIIMIQLFKNDTYSLNLFSDLLCLCDRVAVHVEAWI